MGEYYADEKSLFNLGKGVLFWYRNRGTIQGIEGIQGYAIGGSSLAEPYKAYKDMQ